MTDDTTSHAVHTMPFGDAAPSLSVLVARVTAAHGWGGIDFSGGMVRCFAHIPGVGRVESAPIAVDLCADVWTATEMAAANLLAAIEPQGRRED